VREATVTSDEEGFFEDAQAFRPVGSYGFCFFSWQIHGGLAPPNFVWSGLARSRRRTPPVLAAARILVSKYQAASSFFWTCCFCGSLLSQWIPYPRKLCTCMDGDQVKFRPWPCTACSSGHAPAGGLGLEVLHAKLKAVLWCHAATPGWKICQTLFFPGCWVYLMFFWFQIQTVSKTSGFRPSKEILIFEEFCQINSGENFPFKALPVFEAGKQKHRFQGYCVCWKKSRIFLNPKKCHFSGPSSTPGKIHILSRQFLQLLPDSKHKEIPTCA